MTVAHIEIPDTDIAAVCRRNGIRKLALFGSVLTDRFSESSDIDVLVEFQPRERVGFFRLADIENELSQLLGRRKVDLRTPMDLSRHFREEVLRNALVVYAEPGCRSFAPHAGGGRRHRLDDGFPRRPSPVGSSRGSLGPDRPLSQKRQACIMACPDS
jgi:uncharacterized protein